MEGEYLEVQQCADPAHVTFVFLTICPSAVTCTKEASDYDDNALRLGLPTHESSTPSTVHQNQQIAVTVKVKDCISGGVQALPNCALLPVWILIRGNGSEPGLSLEPVRGGLPALFVF